MWFPKKRLWDSECGGFADHSSYNHPWQLRNAGVRGVRILPQLYVIEAANGVEKTFYYWNAYPWEQRPFKSYEWTWYEFDGVVKAAGVAYAVCAKQIDGAQFVASLRKDTIQAHLFRRGNQNVLALWVQRAAPGVSGFDQSAVASATMTPEGLKGRIQITDCMGNTADYKGGPIRLTQDIQYLSFPQATLDVIEKAVADTRP